MNLTPEKIQTAIDVFEELKNRCTYPNRKENYDRVIFYARVTRNEELAVETKRAVEESNASASTRTLRELLDKYESAIDDFQKSTSDFRHTAFGTERRECDRREKGERGDA